MILAVCTATGVQGTSVVQHVLQDTNLMGTLSQVRCLVRNPESEAAKRLTALDSRVKLYETDMSDARQVAEAFEGVWAVFYNLNSLDPSIGLHEEDIGKAAIDSAIEKGVKVFILSTLPDVESRSQGALHVPHFTLKAHIEAYLYKKRLHILGYAVALGFYIPNFATWTRPTKRDPQDTHFTVSTVMSASTRIPIADPGDVGLVVARTLHKPVRYQEQMIPIVSEMASMAEMVEEMQRFTSQPIKYEKLSYDESVKSIGKELTDMYVYYEKYGFFPPEVDVKLGQQIVSDRPFRTFQKWLQASNFSL
jgi:hypothetical protein